VKPIGYIESYKCGCSSEVVRYKKDLRGYCPIHGENRLYVFTERAEFESGERQVVSRRALRKMR